MEKQIPTKQIAADLAGCAPQDFLVFRELEDGSAVVVIPSGQKFTYTPKQLAQREARLYAISIQLADVGMDDIHSDVETTPADVGADQRVRPTVETKSPSGKAQPVTNRKDAASEPVDLDSASIPLNRKGGSVLAKDQTPKKVNTSSSSSPAVTKTRPGSRGKK